MLAASTRERQSFAKKEGFPLKKYIQWACVTLFLLIELPLYHMILTTGGDTLVYSSFFSIVACFFYALIWAKKEPLTAAGLACTVAADYFLVICDPIQRTWGMVFFLMAQSLYAVRLHRVIPSRVFWILRVGILSLGVAVAWMVLGSKTDLLAILSILYYANLILNIFAAFSRFKTEKLAAFGFLLLILCDTVIGLQVACGGYLPIAEDSRIYKIIFMDFHLSWFFYLPSQILLALSVGLKKR